MSTGIAEHPPPYFAVTAAESSSLLRDMYARTSRTACVVSRSVISSPALLRLIDCPLRQKVRACPGASEPLRSQCRALRSRSVHPVKATGADPLFRRVTDSDCSSAPTGLGKRLSMTTVVIAATLGSACRLEIRACKVGKRQLRRTVTSHTRHQYQFTASSSRRTSDLAFAFVQSCTASRAS